MGVCKGYGQGEGTPKQKRGVRHMFSTKRGASCVRNKIFSFGCRNDAPIHQRRKPAAAAAREVIERKVGFQKNEVELQGREEVTKEKGWEISWRAAKKSD